MIVGSSFYLSFSNQINVQYIVLNSMHSKEFKILSFFASSYPSVASAGYFIHWLHRTLLCCLVRDNVEAYKKNDNHKLWRTLRRSLLHTVSLSATYNIVSNKYPAYVRNEISRHDALLCRMNFDKYDNLAGMSALNMEYYDTISTLFFYILALVLVHIMCSCMCAVGMEWNWRQQQ